MCVKCGFLFKNHGEVTPATNAQKTTTIEESPVVETGPSLGPLAEIEPQPQAKERGDREALSASPTRN